MPKATLTFDLSDPDDRDEYAVYMEAHKTSNILWDYAAWLREQLKYHNAGEEMERCRQRLLDLMADKGVCLDELVK